MKIVTMESVLEVDVHYPFMLQREHRDLPFLPISEKKNGVEKLITRFGDREKYVVHIVALKQALNHGLKSKKVHRVIEFRQEACIKSYIDMNTDLRKNAKNEFEKDFFKCMINSIFGKSVENIRNHSDIKLVTTNEQRKRYVSRPNYHTSKQFSEELMAIEMSKTSIFMDKPVYLGQAILDISKILMYEFYYDYLKVKYKDKVKLCYMDRDSFVLHIKTEDFYEDIANDVNEWFDTSGYNKECKLPRSFPIGVNKKVIGKFKSEISNEIMIKFCTPNAKTYAYLLDSDKEIKKAKGTKKCVIDRILTFKRHANAVLNDETTMTSQLRFKSECHDVCTEKLNKIAINPKYSKRLQTYDRITTYPYGTSAIKVCESEMKMKKNETNCLVSDKIDQLEVKIDNVDSEIYDEKIDDMDLDE